MTITLISQDGLKAIAYDKIQFFVITKDENTDEKNFFLMAKTPTVNDHFYDYLILFEHEDIAVVKQVMRFLVIGDFTIPGGNPKLIFVDLQHLYLYGMPKIFLGE